MQYLCNILPVFGHDLCGFEQILQIWTSLGKCFEQIHTC